MKNDIRKYLASFGDLKYLPRKILLGEIDRAWDECVLSNRNAFRIQQDKVAVFYSHPVWVLNGLFSEHDPESRAHRQAIAACVKKLNVSRVADYGGGSSVLALLIAEAAPNIYVEIIEPYPNDVFVKRFKDFPSVNFVPYLSSDYDVVITQDVLEHLEKPLDLVINLIQATRMNGFLIFANCFYPVIKCHLPTTFYLRHTFLGLMRHAGLEFVGQISGAEHALLFQRVGLLDRSEFDRASKQAKLIGSMLNVAISALSQCKSLIRKIL